MVIKEMQNDEGMTNSNQRIGDENKQTKEYIFFSGTKVRILNEFYNFL